MNPKEVVAALANLTGPLVTRESLETALKKQSLTSDQASSAIQIAINEGFLREDAHGFLHRSGLLRGLWRSRPWRPKPVTAQQILAEMKPISDLPQASRWLRGHPMSAPCALAQLRDDGSLLVHGELASYSFDREEWVEFSKAMYVVDFTPTHYRPYEMPIAPPPFLNFNQRSSKAEKLPNQ